MVLGLVAIAATVIWWRARRVPAGTVTVGELEPADADGGFVDTVAGALREVASMVTPRGYRNNNPGNLRYLARGGWNGQLRDDGSGYAVYESPAAGTRALGRQLLRYADLGYDSVASIITRWAPAVENDTAAYVAHVARVLGVPADARLDVRAQLPALAQAIALHENGYLDASYNWEQWVYL